MADANQSPADQVIVHAATVIVFRQGARELPEILMVQRSKDLTFAGAASVFPGGKVHPSDTALAAGWPEHPIDEASARIAGIREVIEETGLVLGTVERPEAKEAEAARAMLAANEDLAPVLEHFGWTLDLAGLIPFARWLPTFKPGRIFDTRFYLADLGTGAVDLSPDLGENTRLFWSSAKDALDMIETGEIKAIYPTRRNLERLALFPSFQDALGHARETPIEIVSPWIETAEGTEILRIPEGIGYPVTSAPLSQIYIS
jgi:8-oxo-dGTP pyrophosphatase MutT (NUDIX family)